MVKRVAGALLHSIEIDHDSQRTLSTQITIAIKDIILAGGLTAGDRLPATRTLAIDLGVSRTTIVEVFDRLVAEGLLVSAIGAGTFVSDTLNLSLRSRKSGFESLQKKQKTTKSVIGKKQSTSPQRVSGSSIIQSRDFAERLPHQVRAFTTALPALDKFPLALWARQNSRYWRNPREVVLGYGDPAGYRPLRSAIAAHLRTSHAISCEEEQIFISGGAQQAFQLIASVILRQGEKVWIENPGAIGARNALLAAGAQLVPVDVDDEGIIVEQGIRKAADFGLAFVTPVHQQPMAVTMSLARRFALLDAAESADAWIIEDDYDGEFYYGNHRLPGLKSVDRTGRVIHVGTFSKTLFPALRLGYFVVPQAMVDTFQAAVSAYVPGAPSNPQAVVADFMEEGHYATHIRRMRRIYLDRYETFLNCTKQHLSGLIDIKPTNAGLHTIGILNPELLDTKVASDAEMRDITVAPIRRFCVGQTDINGLVMGFSGIDELSIESGIKTLSKILENLVNHRSVKTREPSRAL